MAASLISGCGDHDPYVPFSMSATATVSAAPPVSASADVPAPAPSFQIVSAQPAKGDGQTFALAQGAAKSKKGRIFKLGLPLSADQDALEDLFAWTEAPGGKRAELAFYRGGDEGETSSLAKLPAELDIEHCSRDAKLLRVGQGLVVADVVADCEGAREQWLAVARFDPQSGEPKVDAGPSFRSKGPVTLAARTEDRDADGREDLVLKVSALVDGAPLEGVDASLVLWNRPAGLSWDPSEPEASLGKAGQALLAKAVAKKPDTIARSEHALRFAAALCADLGGGRVSSSAGEPRCQNTRLVGDAVHAVSLAAFNSGDEVRAAAMLDLVAHLKLDGGRSTQLDASLVKKVKRFESVVDKKLTVVPASGGVLSPLAYDETGALLVSSADGVVRVDPLTGEESKSEVLPWSRSLSWGEGDAKVELHGVDTRCAPISIWLTGTAKGSRVELELPLLFALLPKATLKDKCDKAMHKLVPLSISSDGATVALRGELFRLSFGDRGLSAERAKLDPSAPGGRGLSRSPDGKSAAIPLGKSVLLITPKGIERWRGTDAQGLRACAVNDGASRIACLSGESVVVLKPKK